MTTSGPDEPVLPVVPEQSRTEPDPDDEQRARSSVSGRFVSLWYAVTHPRTTTIERRKRREGGGAD